ncbi:MAG: hypothetical protein ACI4JT_05200 [Oscillospiraceae bacterium]
MGEFSAYAEFYRRKCFVEGAGDFSGIEPEKSLHFHRLTADENAWGKLLFPPNPFALLNAFAALRAE